MTIPERLYLDEVISSVPELGPSVTDRGYIWIILIGSMVIRMTVPSILPMYGIILSQLTINSSINFDMWNEEISLTPILFIAFLNLTDPWTRVIINLASAPRLIGFIGVCLLSIGVLASGYLATGGVGAYLASSSAGAVMGIGGSFILVQVDAVLYRNFRSHLRLVLILKEISTSLGFIVAPAFMFMLLKNTSFHIGLLMMALVFIPAVLATLILRYPTVRSRINPYTLLISEEDSELTSPVSNTGDNNDDVNSESVGNIDTKNFFTDKSQHKLDTHQHILGAGSEAYSYQEPEEDQELFNANSTQSSMSVSLGWKQTLQVMKYTKFWIAVVALIGCKACSLFIWILLPPLVILTIPLLTINESVMLSITVALGTVLPNVALFWKFNTARTRSFCFGASLWLGCITLLGLSTELSYSIYFVLAFLGGMSIGGTTVFLEYAILDLLSNAIAKKAHMAMTSITGLCILCFSFIQNPNICLQLTAAIQFIGGCYWLLMPIFGLIQAR